MERKTGVNADQIKKAGDKVKLTNDEEKLKKLKDIILSNNKLLSQDTTKWKKTREDFNKNVKTEKDRIEREIEQSK